MWYLQPPSHPSKNLPLPFKSQALDTNAYDAFRVDDNHFMKQQRFKEDKQFWAISSFVICVWTSWSVSLGGQYSGGRFNVAKKHEGTFTILQKLMFRWMHDNSVVFRFLIVKTHAILSLSIQWMKCTYFYGGDGEMAMTPLLEWFWDAFFWTNQKNEQAITVQIHKEMFFWQGELSMYL